MAEQRATELDLYDSVADEKTRTCLQQLFDNTKNLQAQVDRLVDLITNASNLNALQTQVSQDFSGESIASSTESATDVSAFSAQFSAINHNHDSSYNNYVLNQATTTVLGGIKLGANLTYNSSTDQVDATDTNTVYSLPAASGSTRGGIRVGSYLSVSGDTLSVSSVPSHTHSYAPTNHSHSEYASSSHGHSGYASSSHGHTIGYSNLDSILTDRVEQITALVYSTSTAIPIANVDRTDRLYLRNFHNNLERGMILLLDYSTGIGLYLYRYTINSATQDNPTYSLQPNATLFGYTL
jgi:hypothetical protein